MKQAITAILFGLCLMISTSAAAATEITFWTTEVHADRIAVIKFLVRTYSVMQDDVSVNIVSVNENDLTRLMEQAKGTGEIPHLVGADSQLLVALAEKGCLGKKEATGIVRQIGAERFYPGSLKLLAAPGGKTWYGVPFHGWVQGLWYRADWFEEAGLAPPDNWKAILAAARHFSDPGAGRYGIVVGTADDNYAAQVFTQIARSNGVRMFRADGTVAFDSPATVRALEFYTSLAQYTPRGPQTWRARDYFLQGKLAMLFYSTFIMDDLALAGVASNSLTSSNFEELQGAEFDPDMVRNVRMVPTVRNARKAGYGVINGFGVRKNLSESEQAAVESFLAFLYDPPHYVSWLHMAPGGMMPVLRDVASSNRFLNDPSGIFRRYGRGKVSDMINGLSSIDTFGMVDGRLQPAASVVYSDNVIARMIQRTLFEGVSAKDSVAQAAEEIQEIAESLSVSE